MADLRHSASPRGTLEARAEGQSKAPAPFFNAAEALCTVYPKSRTSQPAKGYKIYPYLLNGLNPDRPNQTWANDIRYIPMAKGFILTVILYWYSLRMLGLAGYNTLETEPCIATLENALAHYGAPEIFDIDQGASYISEASTAVLLAHGVTSSMDEKGRWGDKVVVERLWRSVKYGDVYLICGPMIPRQLYELA